MTHFRTTRMASAASLTALALTTSACSPPPPPPPPTPACAIPQAPVLDIIDDDETLEFTIAGTGPIEVATMAPGDDPANASWTTTDSLPLDARSGPTRVLARSAADGCADAATFDATYDVRSTYPGRPGIAGSDSPAIVGTSPEFVGWPTSYSNYLPGADVTANWQTPDNAVGPYSDDLGVLGNGGEITLEFATPITDGDGYDLAVFENGFYQNDTSELLFAELAWVEVSSNGVDFVRFDSADRGGVPIGGFEFANPRNWGGVAGRDGSGWGTPFDLAALANRPEVRHGTIDLDAVTHVRVVDIVGADDYPDPGDTYSDSFGRQVFDSHPTVGSGGFDLTAIGALHQQ